MNDDSTRTRSLAPLVICACIIQLAILWLDRISVHRAITWAPAEALIRAVFAPLEALFGAVPGDNQATREQVKVANLLIGFLPAFAAYVVACAFVIVRVPANDRRALQLIVGAAALFRLTLVPFPPILETDLHRYVWDGAVSANHVNPYKYAPIEVSNLEKPGHRALYEPHELAQLEALDRLRKAPLLKEHFPHINHPKIPTIYPPLAQIVFSVAYRIAPGSDVAVKALVALADLLIVAMVVALLGALKLNRCQAVVYAWCPLVLKEYANTGHYDPLATLMVLVALHQIVRRIPVLPGIALGLGTLAKLYPIVLATILAPWLGLAGLAVYAATVMMLYIPHMEIGWHIFDGLRAFGKDWEFNSGVFALIEKGFLAAMGKPVLMRIYLARQGDATWAYASDEIVIDAFMLTKLVCGAIGVAILFALVRRPARGDEEALTRTFVATAALVLLSPVSDPWYYAWVMPYAALWPAPSWLYLSGSMVIYYLYFWTWPWGYLPWARFTEYLPFYGMLCGEHAGALAAWARWGAGTARALAGRVRAGLLARDPDA